jgi:hypothetical protein
MRFRQLTLGLALLLLVAGWANAGEWGPAPPSILQAGRDMRLTIWARATLRKDPELNRLGVQVRDGIAYVWGPVKDRAMERRAVSRLELIVGIEDVKTDCSYGRPAPKPPTDAVAARKVDLPSPDFGKPAPPPLPPKKPVVRAVVKPAPKKPAATSVSRSPAPSLPAAIEAARKADPRFPRVRIVMDGINITVLRGDDDVAASLFAQRLQAIPGVGDVLLDN